MKFTIKKKNGTILNKDVDSSNKDLITKLKKIGWKTVTSKKKKSKK